MTTDPEPPPDDDPDQLPDGSTVLDVDRRPADGDREAEELAAWCRETFGGSRGGQTVEHVQVTRAVTGPDGEPAGLITEWLPMVTGDDTDTEED